MILEAGLLSVFVGAYLVPLCEMLKIRRYMISVLKKKLIVWWGRFYSYTYIYIQIKQLWSDTSASNLEL